MPNIAPTIGRKVYYQPRGQDHVAKYDEQPLDATIIYVWPKVDPTNPFDLVNLFVVDHAGQQSIRAHVPLVQDGQEAPLAGHYVEWMPYQKGQAAKTEVIEAQQTLAANLAAQTAMVNAAPIIVDPQTASIPASTNEVLNAEPVATPLSQAPTPENGSTSPLLSEPQQPITSEVTPTSTNGDFGSSYIGSSDFGGALSALKAGKKVARAGWNGKGMFVYLVPAASYPAQTGAAKSFFGEGAMVPYNAYLAIKNVDNSVSTWVPSVNDVLADDWSVL